MMGDGKRKKKKNLQKDFVEKKQFLSLHPVLEKRILK